MTGRLLYPRPKRFAWRKATHCYWCGQYLIYGGMFENGASRDHLMPLAKGGSTLAENVVAACRACNSARGHDVAWVPFHQMDEPRDRPLPALQSQRLHEVGYWRRKAAVRAKDDEERMEVQTA